MKEFYSIHILQPSSTSTRSIHSSTSGISRSHVNTTFPTPKLCANITMGLIANPTIPDEDCTLATCSLLQAHYQYLPSLAGNALYVSLFSILLLSQTILGYKSKAWGFMIGFVFGIILEIVGYVGRIQMHSNPFIDKGFLSYVSSLN